MAKKNEAITARDVDFAQWYTDVCRKAELMDYSSVKGFIIYRPYGYAIWEKIQAELDQKFKATGHENVYMPMLIPESLLQKEADHVEGFAPECAVVTKGGLRELEEPLVIRPTSETLFCEHFARIVSSYRDLPKKYNQWCSVVRWEKTTRPFLRGAEFLWQEGHTIHATAEEAEQEALDMLKIYEDMAKDLLAIPMLTGIKTESEKFAGAEKTYCLEALMHDGQALQAGTTHYFGQGFAQAFHIQFLDQDGQQKYVYQTSWGVSTRLIGALIMVHGDDNGLVLPPKVAPVQVVVVPIQMAKPGVMDMAVKITDMLKEKGIRVKLDDGDKSPGWKFADAEMRGIPLRIEIGPKDLEKGVCVLCRRVDGVKETVPVDENLADHILEQFAAIHDVMYENAVAHQKANTFAVTSYEDFKKQAAKGGYIKAMWCGDPACEKAIKQETSATTRCIRDDEPAVGKTCIYCGKPAKHLVYFAKAY